MTTMDCEATRDDLMDVLYGEADAVAEARVERHLERCPSCRDELGAFRAVRTELAAWQAPASAPLVRRRFAWPALARAAVVAIAFGGGAFLARAPYGGLEARLAAQEERHRQEIAALRATLAAAPARAADEATLRLVAEMIRQSEARQASAFEATLADFRQRTEAQRRHDLARVSAGFAYLDGRTLQDAARTNELMGYVLQASQKR